MLVLLVFLALLREPRAEGATRVPPAALGLVPGLDRAARKTRKLKLSLAAESIRIAPGSGPESNTCTFSNLRR